MTFRFAQFFLLGFFLFSFVLTALPLPVSAAGLIPCGRSVDDPSTSNIETERCTICHIIVGGKGIMDWGLRIMTYVAIAIIVAMAVFYIVSAGSEEMMTTAKGGIKAALVGFAVMLGAWLIISTTLRIFSATIPGLTMTSGGFEFSCGATAGTGVAVGTGTGAASGTNVPNTGVPNASVPSTNGNTGTVSTALTCGVDPVAEKQRINNGGTVCNNSGVCPSCNTSAFETFIQNYGNAAGIPLAFIRGLIARESTCNPNAERLDTDGTRSCGLMGVNTRSSSYTCDQLKNPDTGIKEGVRILQTAFTSARSLTTRYGSRVTVEELAAAIHNAGYGQSTTSVDCSTSSGWLTIPKWGCPINPGTAQFNACNIKNYACNVGSCR